MSQSLLSTLSKHIFLQSTLVSLLLMTSCTNQDRNAVWKESVPSPDLAWIASAITVQNGGFGSGGISTTVYLSRAQSASARTEVLGFSCDGPIPRPYVLDQANRGGSINLKMRWMTPTHLEVTYTGHPDLYFQAVKLAGIDITVRDVSKEATKN